MSSRPAPSRFFLERRSLVVAAPRIAAAAAATLYAPAFALAERAMPPLDGAVAWINSPPLTPAGLRGKVVLVDFWTYTCINWQRTLPHVRAWADKYRDKGLVVVGVHTPEFSFEKDVERVRRACAQFRIGYPVAVDSNRAVWNAFHNSYWPALYFVDARGMVRHHHFGEGEFERSEGVIQQLLMDAGAMDVPRGLVRVAGTGSLAKADWTNLRTPETYVGHDRSAKFSSPGGMKPGLTTNYTAPARLRLNTWALAGDWTVGPEAAVLEQPNGRIAHSFHARDLHLVMGPAVATRPVPFRVRLDGKPPGSAHGTDVDAQGRGVLAEHRLHQLIRQPGAVADRMFEIEFDQPGAQAYAFTFG